MSDGSEKLWDFPVQFQFKKLKTTQDFQIFNLNLPNKNFIVCSSYMSFFFVCFKPLNDAFSIPDAG